MTWHLRIRQKLYEKLEDEKKNIDTIRTNEGFENELRHYFIHIKEEGIDNFVYTQKEILEKMSLDISQKFPGIDTNIPEVFVREVLEILEQDGKAYTELKEIIYKMFLFDYESILKEIILEYKDLH